MLEVGKICKNFSVPELADVFAKEQAAIELNDTCNSHSIASVSRVKKALDRCIKDLHSSIITDASNGDTRFNQASTPVLLDLDKLGQGDLARHLYVAEREYKPIQQDVEVLKKLERSLRSTESSIATDRSMLSTLNERLSGYADHLATLKANCDVLRADQVSYLGAIEQLASQYVKLLLDGVREDTPLACFKLKDRLSLDDVINCTNSQQSVTDCSSRIQAALQHHQALVKVVDQLNAISLAYNKPKELSSTATPANSDLILPAVPVERENSVSNSDNARVANTHIRWMIRRDMPFVLNIESKCFGFPWSKDEFVRCLRQRDCIGMVAERNEDVVGFMIYELHKTRIHILSFAVDPEQQRSGAGTAMVDKLISKLAFQRRNRIVLEVRETNLPAQHFFRAMGFRATSVLRDFYEDSAEDAYLMQYRQEKPEE